jgi:hypothetical protein
MRFDEADWVNRWAKNRGETQAIAAQAERLHNAKHSTFVNCEGDKQTCATHTDDISYQSRFSRLSHETRANNERRSL